MNSMPWQELPDPIVDEFERAIADFLGVWASAAAGHEEPVVAAQSQISPGSGAAFPGLVDASFKQPGTP